MGFDLSLNLNKNRYIMIINSKLPNVGVSIFAVMSQLANEHKALNLSQGFPNFDPPRELIELFHKYQLAGMNQYAPMTGIPKLRSEIALLIQELYAQNYNPETEITITAGATQAIYSTINALINKDDEVIILEPAYDSYYPAIAINGGIPIPIKLNPLNFSIDWGKVTQSFSSRTKMLILNYPHNPTGVTLKEEDIVYIKALSEKYNFFILSDEVYEHIIFDNREHLSICKYSDLAERSIIISSFGKTFHTTGWKVGYIAAPNFITKEIRKVHQFTVFAVNTPAQFAFADFLSNRAHINELKYFYQTKRDLFIQNINQNKFRLTKAEGTYFQLLDYSNLSDKNDFDFAKELIEKIGVAVIPLSPFYENFVQYKYVRICFAKTDDILIDAANRLNAFE